jgi:chromosome segregation protein
MRLERLEINGFKSFSDRSELAFDKGVTAIVGPNGCGKSNVADAITWVMGEQSAKSLRGDRMEDVIFSGSDARKPTAAAEVRLRFSGVVKQVMAAVATEPEAPVGAGAPGTGAPVEAGAPEGAGFSQPDDEAAPSGFSQGAPDADGRAGAYESALSRIPHPQPLTPAEELIRTVAREVEVTRRLYRSGESEYLIDGQICRLRDIHDLLMDTGLGAKAYAIIEQGKIGMILSTRPTDRRQLIEEAAGVTKYKARRRAAELKLEAAQQNLTRIDDIVYEVEKQRGTLKRQAAKARRYQKLRDELRRWEKVLFARKYRQLAETIESARTRLADARDREAAAAARVAEVESDLGRARIELVEAETQATRTRETAHARELAINRRQQQIAFDKEQIGALSARTAVVGAELQTLEARREPARAALAERREAAASANVERDRAAGTLASDSEAYETAAREIEGLEADVEAARSEVFSAINSATALRHSLEHGAQARDRVLETLSKLQVEAEDARIEGDRAAQDRAAAADGLRRAQEAIEATRVARVARESELASARIEHEWRSRSLRAREQELARLEARLKSLEELEAARLEYGDAARAVLAQANGKVNQRGAVADYLEVDAGYERAVEACLGDLLQHVIVEQPQHAAAGFEMVKEQQAGRCGFLIASEVDSTPADLLHTVGADLAAAEVAAGVSEAPPEGVIAMASVMRVNGPFAGAIRKAIGPAWIASSYQRAADVSRQTSFVVGTTGGDLFRGPHLVAGGSPVESRGILETKRDIKDLRARIAAEREALSRLIEETTGLEAVIANASAAVAALNAEHHRHEKAVVALEAQSQRAAEDAAKVAQKAEQLARERRQAEDERDTLQRRQEEAREAIERLDHEQRLADERLTTAQRRLFEARESTQDLSHRAAEAKAAHAALVERAAALAAEVLRLEEAGAELEARAAALSHELEEARQRIDELRAGVVAAEQQLDADVHALEMLRADVVSADEAVSALRAQADALEATIKEARGALDHARAVVSELEIARATAESDLTHLASTCIDAVQATLDEVLAEVAALEAEGAVTPDARAIEAEEPEEPTDESGDATEVRLKTDPTPMVETTSDAPTMTAEEAIARLRAKIDRLGPVNMMAIEQFDELETRHGFLVTQRKDLVDSIAQTSEAIRRIDETTRQRFVEAFAAINRNFQETFNTLFGGGRATLTLLDENDPLESGIEIVAQPPGKRLQSVQLLSGGEKALTAISLMFGLFKYKPSPFCLLDEIDAPLDDANVGRFVEMLRSMQQHTQFILITHNRKTMEIADRLYGVTMEEPGVSKLISVQLN